MSLFVLDGRGSFDQDFIVSLKIYSGDLPSLGAMEGGASGTLPPAPDLPKLYEAWIIAYRNYVEIRAYNPTDNNSPATFAFKKRPVETNVSGNYQEWKNQKQQAYQVCIKAEKKLIERFHEWLNWKDFGKVKDTLKAYLLKSKEQANYILIESNKQNFQNMPWQKWNLLQEFSLSEIGLISPNFKKRDVSVKPKKRARVLVILGKDANIQQEIQQLATDKIEIKVVSTLVELDEPLWNEAWDIIVFNGHSGTFEKGIEGKFQLSSDQWLSISDIKNHLNKTIEQGLKLVIFNSCDGLGLAHQLGEGQELYLPQIMVMRDVLPVPLAPIFLQYFFGEFINGISLYSALRATRDRLKIHEQEFPCASWLPVIFQNPAEAPLIFQNLLEKKRLQNLKQNLLVNQKEKLLNLLSQLIQAERARNFELVIQLGEGILKINIQHQIARTKTALAYKQRILSYYNQGKYDEAIQDCDRAILLSPENADLYYQRARVYHQRNNWEKVIDNCTKALKLRQEADYYWQRGRAYCNQYNYDQAIKDAKAALAINRQKADYHYLLGFSFYQKGLSILLKANDQILGIYDQEKSNEVIKLYNEGIHALNEAIKINPDQVANYYWIRGLCYFGIAKNEQAIDDFNKANQLDPNSKTYNYNYWVGLSYFNKKDYTSAILYLTLAVGFLNESKQSDDYYYLSYSYYNRDYSAERNYTESHNLLKTFPDLNKFFNNRPESDVLNAKTAIEKAIEIGGSKLEYLILKDKIEQRIKQRMPGKR